MPILIAHHESICNPVVIAGCFSAVAFVWRFGRLFFASTKDDRDHQH